VRERERNRENEKQMILKGILDEKPEEDYFCCF
jgi:hypothetical protein